MPEVDVKRNGSPIHHKGSGLYILYVSTFPPRRCGIATFTDDLTHAMDNMLSPVIKSKIAALNPDDVLSYNYPKNVIFQFNQNNERDYIQIAREINRMKEVRLVHIQHEFGIFGGELGSHLFAFIRTLKKPVVINFHTVIPAPYERLRDTVRTLSDNISAITVMTTLSKKILVEDYGISDKKIRVIPHGIHPQPFTLSRSDKLALGFSDRVVLSTFGLLNRGKGLEYVIEALPEVIKRFPSFVYIYFGATHPVVLREEGESYRNEIIQKIYNLGLFDHVKLYNRFFPLGELLRFLRATDIYISPGLEPNQAVSGTLSYALGMGRPVISTAFANARELITDDVGILVNFRDPQSYTDAILKLLEDEGLRGQMGRNAYFKTRRMVWPNVALQYSKVFSELVPRHARVTEKKSLPKLKLDHLIRLTDDFGVIQFAKLNRPDVRSGYTLDDNARALVASAHYYRKLGKAVSNPVTIKQKRVLLQLIEIYLEFIHFVSQTDGLFWNYIRYDHKLDRARNEKADLEDASSRALYALAVTSATGALPRKARQKAMVLLQSKIDGKIKFSSPRALARWSKTLCVLFENKVTVSGLNLEQAIKEQNDRLISLYEATSSPDWQWFESYITYSNPIMPEALLLGYRVVGDERYLKVGRTTLDFLIKECFIEGIYIPVGQNGWYHKEGRRNNNDQQPQEVSAMVCALRTCYEVTKEHRYHELMHRAFNWFLGDNSLNQVVYDVTTGGCYDGVGRKTVNLNQGAESTLSYLIARVAF